VTTATLTSNTWLRDGIAMSEILFADDDDSIRQMVSDVLRAAGYEVRAVSSGGAVLEEARRALPDLVLLDYRMGRPDGFEVCRLLKADRRTDHLPVLILTGESEVENRLLGFDAGADDYLAKPFDPRELLARVRALLRLSRQSLDRNPTTGIPGALAAEREFVRWRDAADGFAVCYLDLDHFKPFADRFGFGTADNVIREVGEAIRQAIGTREAFVGHIGGDDFIVLCDRDAAYAIVAETRERFRTGLLRHLPKDVAAGGVYTGKDREGRTREFPLTALSAAIVYTAAAVTHSLAELGEPVAEAKLRAKLDTQTGIAEVRLA
jgi:PleD family two-component response regulator